MKIDCYAVRVLNGVAGLEIAGIGVLDDGSGHVLA